ncbi:MAG: L-lysine 6-transaminase [Planctomycetota bacterium]
MQTTKNPFRTAPGDVHEKLGKYMLADGFSLVFDYEKSQGVNIHDSRTGETYLDLFSFFASQPLGFNHPKMTDPAFVEKLAMIALVKPTNSDVYTQAMADFVETFAEVTIPASHRNHLFFVEGGGLAVENAMKAAFDWKYRKNVAKGGTDTEDLQILHFENAFHGRTGYTLTVTNTNDPRKYQYFPKFDWPRAPTPTCVGDVAGIEASEKVSLEAIRTAIAERPDKIAGILIETIQGEGGDNHFRAEFLRELRDICDREDILLIFDEVQCGMGLTGTWWAFEQLGVEPDIFCFGKKAQVCGIAANKRLDEVESVFQVSSRINSTWGGNLVDMVRSEQCIRIIKEDNLLDNVNKVGAIFQAGLEKIASETAKIKNVRGRGVMLAFDFDNEKDRDAFSARLYERKVLMLTSGNLSMRTRPVLDMDQAAVERALAEISASL